MCIFTDEEHSAAFLRTQSADANDTMNVSVQCISGSLLEHCCRRDDDKGSGYRGLSPSPVDVIVCADIVDGDGLLQTNILQELRFALHYFDRHDGATDIGGGVQSRGGRITMLPQALRVMVMAVECPALIDHHRVRSDRTCGVSHVCL